MAGIDAVVVSGTLLAARRLVGIAYSSEEEVISSVAAIVPLVCITVITDCIQGILSGLLLYLTFQKAILQHNRSPLICLPPLSSLLIRRRPRVRVAAPGRVREPWLVLPAGDPDGDPPRLCAAHGVQGALDGHRLWLPVADHAHVRHHILHRLAQDGTFISLIHQQGCTQFIAAAKMNKYFVWIQGPKFSCVTSDVWMLTRRTKHERIIKLIPQE